MRFRKSTTVGFLIFLATAVAVLLANPETRSMERYHQRLLAAKAKWDQVRAAGDQWKQGLSESRQEALDRFEKLLTQTAETEKYQFRTMREREQVLERVEPIIESLYQSARTALPPVAGEMPRAEAEAPEPAMTPPAPAAPAAGAKKRKFVIADDEGC